mgnify:CR=1 FL=1
MIIVEGKLNSRLFFYAVRMLNKKAYPSGPIYRTPRVPLVGPEGYALGREKINLRLPCEICWCEKLSNGLCRCDESLCRTEVCRRGFFDGHLIADVLFFVQNALFLYFCFNC